MHKKRDSPQSYRPKPDEIQKQSSIGHASTSVKFVEASLRKQWETVFITRDVPNPKNIASTREQTRLKNGEHLCLGHLMGQSHGFTRQMSFDVYLSV